MGHLNPTMVTAKMRLNETTASKTLTKFIHISLILHLFNALTGGHCGQSEPNFFFSMDGKDEMYVFFAYSV